MPPITQEQVEIIRQSSRDEGGFETIMGIINMLCHLQMEQRKQIEDDLQIRNNALEAATSGIVIAEAGESNHIIYANPAVERITGYRADELLGRNMRFLQGDDIQQPQLVILREALKERRETTVTLRNYRKDGALFWNELRISPVYNSEGKLTHFIGILNDITWRIHAEEALKQSEADLRSIFDNTLISFTLIDADFNIRAVNRVSAAHAQRVFGKPTTPGHSIFEFVLADDRAAFEALFRRSLNGENVVIEKSFNPQYGQNFYFEMHFTPVKTEDGEIVGVCMVSEEITRRKMQEIALRHSEKRYKAIVNTQTELVCRYTPDRKLTFVNEAYCKYFQKSPEELIGHDLITFAAENNQEAVTTEIQYAIDHPGPHVQEHQIIAPDGSIRWQRWTRQGIREDDGTIREIQAVGFDITERKIAQEELSSAKETLEYVINAANDGFWDWNLITGEIYFSPQWKQIIGYTDDDFPNSLESWQTVIFPEDAEIALQMVEDYNTGILPEFTMTQRFRHKNGSTVYILSRAIHLKDDEGRVYRMIGAHTDITELVQAREAAETASRAKSTFMAGITHELRTPLNAILGFTQLLEEAHELTPENQKHVTVIKERGQHLLEMIDRIIEVSRLETTPLDAKAKEAITATRLLKSITSTPLPENDLLPNATTNSKTSPEWDIAQAISSIPGHWREELKMAATELDSLAANRLINSVYHQHPELAQVLWDWVEEFHFSKILEIIGEVDSDV